MDAPFLATATAVLLANALAVLLVYAGVRMAKNELDAAVVAAFGVPIIFLILGLVHVLA